MAEIKEETTVNAAKACLAELQAVLVKHGFVLGHEDSQGAFKLIPRACLGDTNAAMYVAWFNGAYVESE